MIYNTEEDLHTLLDGLTDGEHIKATWAHGAYLTATEGPVGLKGQEVWCRGVVRWNGGNISSHLTSLEVACDEEVTVTRDDEEALHALIDSLEDGQEVTAEWRDAHGSLSVTGKVLASGTRREVDGCGYSVLRRHTGVLHDDLHAVTARRPAVQRWERGGNE